ncbi:hypothetical protein BGX29_011147, partial [Mortierella sp. GBA35]
HAGDTAIRIAADVAVVDAAAIFGVAVDPAASKLNARQEMPVPDMSLDNTRTRCQLLVPEGAACTLHGIRGWRQTTVATFRNPVMIVEMVVALQCDPGSCAHSGLVREVVIASSSPRSPHWSVGGPDVFLLIPDLPQPHAADGAPVGGAPEETSAVVLASKMFAEVETPLQRS